MEHLEQPLVLLGRGIENPATGIHSDEKYLYVVELPPRSPFDEPAERTDRSVAGVGHSAFALSIQHDAVTITASC